MVKLRSALFTAAFMGWTGFLCLVFVWLFAAPRPMIMGVIRWYLDSVGWLERVVLGLRWTLVGTDHLPPGPCIIAAKHQSAWETLKLHRIFRDPAVVYKRELGRIPIWGWFLVRIDMIAVDRGAGGRAVRSLVAGARGLKDPTRPIVIFPQGTRVPPGEWRAYRQGVGVLYRELGIPIVPVALNSGLFWPKSATGKRGGVITVEILPPILPGLPRAEALAILEERLEAASDRLVVAAGGPPTVRPSVPRGEPRPAADEAVA